MGDESGTMQPLKVAIIWHMHQPDYRDPASGQALLPWVYLHAVKDYGEMLATAREIPGVRLTFNLVPILLDQLAAYGRGELSDRWLDAARRDPKDMDLQERTFLVDSFFSVHGERCIQPYARFRELAALKEAGGRRAVEGFGIQDLRDLQVWFLLSWAGHHARREHRLIDRLLAKGRGFTEPDKGALLKLYDRLVAEVLDAYRAAEDSGLVELSITPYAHPILPLLCDSAVAARARSGVQLPQIPFVHPEDARTHLRLAARCAEQHLGGGRRGVWPAEGAVSDVAVRLMAEEGALWAASDEEILARSLTDGLQDRRRLYRPYEYAGLPLLFRDRALSDRVGFAYARWPAAEAAADLLDRLQAIARQAPGGLVALILDGENCWEGYEDNGYPFLKALYQGLLESPELAMVTVSEALADLPLEPLSRLSPGSWINGDFDIWIGHDEENRAWELLAAARQAALEAGGLDGNPSAALEHLLHAEGSDWFWWFGEHHRTEQAETFDRLFRHHLQAVYQASGQRVPAELLVPIKAPQRRSRVVEPAALISPVIDGRITDYFEWLLAGSVELAGGSAMHDASCEMTGLWFGYDEYYFYLRFDFRRCLVKLAGASGQLEVRLRAGEEWLATLPVGGQPLILQRCSDAFQADGGLGAVAAIAELAVPLQLLGLQPGSQLELSWRLLDEGRQLASWPVDGVVLLNYLGAGLEDLQWPV